MSDLRVTVSTLMESEGWLTVSLDAESREEAFSIFETFTQRAPGPSLVSMEEDGHQLLFLSTFVSGVRYTCGKEARC